jgi:peroxiredoxin
MIVALVSTWIAVLVLGWLGWQLLRQNGRLLLQLETLEQRLDELSGPPEPEGLPVGSVAPEFDLPDLTGERRTLERFRSQPLLLIFFNPDCGYCREMAPKLAALEPRSSRRAEAHISDPQLSTSDQSLVNSAATQEHPHQVIITTGDPEKNRQFFRDHKIKSPVLLQKDGEVARVYQANGTPTGYLVGPDGRIASKLAVGADALLALANGDTQPSPLNLQPGDDRASRFSSRSLARSNIARDGLKAGTPAPLFRLPRLDGGELALEELRGRRVLLVFSDPHCGPCDALAPRLEQLHREHPELRVVMISRGEPKENRAKVKEHGLTFPVVLQQRWEISRRYAMFATPIAYLIDEAGVIAHEVAIGEEAISHFLSETKSGNRENSNQDPSPIAAAARSNSSA